VRLRGDRAVIDEPLFEGEFGRIRTVVEGPDGALYLLTSNRDGRGEPSNDDDRIIRVSPPRERGAGPSHVSAR
jgi:aldose sugar dehydrogenase